MIAFELMARLCSNFRLNRKFGEKQREQKNVRSL